MPMLKNKQCQIFSDDVFVWRYAGGHTLISAGKPRERNE